MTKLSITTILLALLLAVPAASASWRGLDSQEPDTAYDEGSFMWTNPPADGAGAVYFNTVMTDTIVAQGSSTTGSRMENYGLLTFWALLGVWADCNGDGYVGQAESAMLEYPSALLATNPNVPADCVDGGPHNSGGWVTELIPIAADAHIPGGKTPKDYDPRVLEDDTAAIWGDFGLPGALPRTTCAVTPWEPKTTTSTGGLLDYSDCILANNLAKNFNNVATAAGQPGVATDGRKHAWAESSWSKPTGGSDDSANSAVKYSCSGDPVWASEGGTMNSAYAALPKAARGIITGGYGENTGSDPDFRTMGPHVPGAPSPNPPQPRADVPGAWSGGNAPGTMNATWESTLGDCNTANDGGNDFYSCGLHSAQTNRPCDGQNIGQTAIDGRNQPDFTFSYSATHRGALPSDPLGGPTGTGVGAVDNAPEDFGLYPISAAACTAVCSADDSQIAYQDHQNLWVSQSAYVTAPLVFNGGTTRQNVGDFRGAQYYSFYAHVASTDGALPGGHGVYGAEACPVHGAGAQPANGWVCDGSKWYANQNTRYNSARVGDAYELRDIDCADGTIVRGVPVYAGPANLATARCDS